MCRGVPFQITRLYVKEPGWYRTVAEPDPNEAGHRHPFIVDRTDYISCSSSDDDHVDDCKDSSSCLDTPNQHSSTNDDSNSVPFMRDYEVEVLGDDQYAREMFEEEEDSTAKDASDVCE